MTHLIPQPNGHMQTDARQWILPQTLSLCHSSFAPYCTEAFLARTGVKPGDGAAQLRLVKDSRLPAEAYDLTISTAGIQVAASCEAGVIWALTTVFCLLRKRQLPCCSIRDEPVFPHRGVLLDCARHFFSCTEVKRVIEGISLAKINVLHWHLSDDQGWRIESKRFPLLQQTSGAYYTQQEIREIVEYARVRGVEILPELDMPGHTAGILAAYPQYSCSGKTVALARSGGIYPVILCPGKEETFRFLQALLEEILPLFPGPRFHIGGDEAPKPEWAKCPCCQKRIQDEHLNGLNALQGYFTGRVAEILKRNGKQAVCWNETLAAGGAPQDLLIQYWTPDHRAEMEPFIRGGGRWVYSDMFALYLDYPYSMTPLRKVYTALPHLGKKVCTAKDGLLGMECCLWTEHIEQGGALERMLFPRVYALAESCWSGTQDYADFRRRLQEALRAGCFSGVACQPAAGWDPHGRARRREALAYFQKMNAAMSSETREQTLQAARPSREFQQSFLTGFFRPSDMPFLLCALKKDAAKQTKEEHHAKD